MKNVSRILALTLAGSMVFLCGCTELNVSGIDMNQFDMGQIDELAASADSISNNVNTMIEKANDGSIEQLETDIDSMSESVAELEAATAETADLVAALQENFMEIPFDELDYDAILAAYDDSPIGTVMNIEGNANAAITEAEAKYNEGMQLYMDSYNSLAALDLTEGTVKHGIHEVYYYAEEMVNGLNLATEGLAILIDRFSDMGSDVIEVAELAGVEETEELALLKDVLAVTGDNLHIYIMGPDTHEIFDESETKLVAQLSDTDLIDGLDADPVIDEIFDEIEPVTENIKELNAAASDYVKAYSPAAKAVISEVKASGIVDESTSEQLDMISEIIDASAESGVTVFGMSVNGESDLTKIAEMGRSVAKDLFAELKEEAKKQIRQQMELD